MRKSKIKYTKNTTILILLMLSNTAMAEYRAYQYIVKSKIKNSSQILNSKSTIISSTLSPVSFIAYNGGTNIIEIDLINTWYCPGNTSKKKICSPRRQGNNGD